MNCNMTLNDCVMIGLAVTVTMLQLGVNLSCHFHLFLVIMPPAGFQTHKLCRVSHTCDMPVVSACIQCVTLFLSLGKHHNTSCMLWVEEFLVSEPEEGERSAS
jgi:hypothetical protein